MCVAVVTRAEQRDIPVGVLVLVLLMLVGRCKVNLEYTVVSYAYEAKMRKTREKIIMKIFRKWLFEWRKWWNQLKIHSKQFAIDWSLVHFPFESSALRLRVSSGAKNHWRFDARKWSIIGCYINGPSRIGNISLPLAECHCVANAMSINGTSAPEINSHLAMHRPQSNVSTKRKKLK